MEQVIDVVDVSVDNVQTVVESSNERLVVMSFYSESDSESQTLNQQLIQLSAPYTEHMVIAQVNCDVEPQMAQYFQIQSLPTLILLQKGRMVDGCQGQQTNETLEALLKSYLPEIWQIAFQKAQALLASGETELALKDLKVAAQASFEPNVYQLWVETLIRAKKFDEAKMALQSEHTTLDSVATLGFEQQLHAALQASQTPEFQKAREAYLAHPEDPQVVFTYAKQLNESGQIQEAMSILWAMIDTQKSVLNSDLHAYFKVLLTEHDQDHPVARMYQRKLYGLLH